MPEPVPPPREWVIWKPWRHASHHRRLVPHAARLVEATSQDDELLDTWRAYVAHRLLGAGRLLAVTDLTLLDESGDPRRHGLAWLLVDVQRRLTLLERWLRRLGRRNRRRSRRCKHGTAGTERRRAWRTTAYAACVCGPRYGRGVARKTCNHAHGPPGAIHAHGPPGAIHAHGPPGRTGRGTGVVAAQPSYALPPYAVQTGAPLPTLRRAGTGPDTARPILVAPRCAAFATATALVRSLAGASPAGGMARKEGAAVSRADLLVSISRRSHSLSTATPHRAQSESPSLART